MAVKGTHGILCFSADGRDPVIGAHYSDKHRGVCLGFDIPDNKGRKVDYMSDCLCENDPNFVMLPLGFTRNIKIGDTKKRFGVARHWKKHQKACISWSLRRT